MIHLTLYPYTLIPLTCASQISTPIQHALCEIRFFRCKKSANLSIVKYQD